jgi:hypothetical protein
VLIVDDAIREVTRNGVEVRNLPLPYRETTHALPYDNDTIWISSPINGGNEPGIISLVDWNGNSLITVERFHFPFQTRRLNNDAILIADGTGRLTELTPGGEIARTIGLSNWATSIAISEDGSIFYGRPDGYSHISATGAELSMIRDVRIESIDYLPWGNLIIAAWVSDNFIKEVTSSGIEVWSIPLDKPRNVRFIE